MNSTNITETSEQFAEMVSPYIAVIVEVRIGSVQRGIAAKEMPHKVIKNA